MARWCEQDSTHRHFLPRTGQGFFPHVNTLLCVGLFALEFLYYVLLYLTFIIIEKYVSSYVCSLPLCVYCAIRVCCRLTQQSPPTVPLPLCLLLPTLLPLCLYLLPFWSMLLPWVAGLPWDSLVPCHTQLFPMKETFFKFPVTWTYAHNRAQN